MARPPKGYRMEEHPLMHKNAGFFGLRAFDNTSDATMITLFRSSEVELTPETIEVNPSNPAWQQEAGVTIHNGSIVPQVNFTMKMNLTKTLTDLYPQVTIKVNFMPIYISFLESLEAEDVKTATQVEDILELTHATASKRTEPLWTGTKLTNESNHALNTVTSTETFSASWGLGTDATLESIAFIEDDYWDAIRHMSISGMLSRNTGRIHRITLNGQTRPAATFSTKGFTSPLVKRGNPYTFCGLIVWLNPQNNTKSYGRTDLTDIDHVQVNFESNFPEWNQNFDQSAY